MNQTNHSNQMYTIYGFHAISARLEHHTDSILTIYVDDRFQARPHKRSQSFMDIAKQKGVRVVFSPSIHLDTMAQTQQHQGVVAQVRAIKQINSLEELLYQLEDQEKVAHLLILDGITDPHNLGACLRVADAAGMQGIILPKHHSVSVNALVDKISSGASAYVPVIQVTNLNRALDMLKQANIWTFATSDKAANNIYQTTLTMPLAWILGAEGTGVRRLVMENADECVSIPMQGYVNSLNISVACGVCAFETVRQRIK